MKLRIACLITITSLLFIYSCGKDGLFDMKEENKRATIEVLYPEKGKSYFKTSMDSPSYLVIKLTDPDKNGRILRVTGNGTVEITLNEDPKYYDEEPDTIRHFGRDGAVYNISEVVYPEVDNNLVSLTIEVEDDAEENKFSMQELDFYLYPDEVFIKDPKLSKKVYMGQEYTNIDFDISTLSGDLGSVVSLNFTTSPNNPRQGTTNLFEVYNGYWSRIIVLSSNGNSFESDGPINDINLTSHYSSMISGAMDSGDNLYLYVYVFDPSQVNSITSGIYKKYDLGVIP
ncbi:MAG: hypothetical protein WD491_00390 [Balneolales bacterium]